MEDREGLVALNMVEHVGPVRVRQLLSVFGSAKEILRAKPETLQKVPGIGPETANAIASWESSIDLSAELRRAREFNCTILTQLDSDYPKPLLEIYDPPLVLYVLGSILPRDQQAIAIVGSRLTTHYGIEVARRFAYQLAYVGVTVVSGGARGIDTAAHQGALNAKGRTIAVLGTGINLVFPPENADLFQRIPSNGALVSQFPFNRKADKQSFPIRNRIVAGMTLGTVVVEANLTSGAMITANMATDYGRQVFAVPGRIDSPRSKGCHSLIKQGAKLCETPEDILTEFEYLFPPSNRKTSSPTDPSPTTHIPLTENEQCLLNALPAGSDAPIDLLILQTQLPPATVSVTLLALEMKGLVRQLPGKIFSRS